MERCKCRIRLWGCFCRAAFKSSEMNISSHLSTSGVSQPPYPSPMIRSGDETLTESPRTLATDAGNKDGLIRMLLQNATPTPPPSGTSPMGPPHPTNLPPIPKWPTSPLNALASPSSVPTTPLTSPKALTPGIFSSTPAITVQPPPSNVNIITVDVTTDDQNSPFIYQISGTVSLSFLSHFQLSNLKTTLNDCYRGYLYLNLVTLIMQYE